MKNLLLPTGLCLLLLSACNKELEPVPSNPQITTERPTAAKPFVAYTINKGEHYCDHNVYTPVQYQQLSFTVRFDSSAVYTSKILENQDDINKLYGFSDNDAHHHEYSARFGWRWSESGLQLLGYVYNKGVRSSALLGTIALGTNAACSIKISADQYLFTLDGKTTALPRMATTPIASGYKLYPYFGGDETAPHTVQIWILEQ